MTMTTRLTLATALLGLSGASIAHAGGSPLGVWMDDTGRGGVEIVDCGNGKLCGKLVWLQDGKNSKACGTAILGDVGKVGGSWDGGWIYSPEKDEKYDVELTPSGSNKLTVLGYAGTKLFSKEMTWTRAPAGLKRCDAMQEAKAAPPMETATATVTPPVAVAPAANVGATGTVAAAAPVPPRVGSGKSAIATQPAVAAVQPKDDKGDSEKWASEPDSAKQPGETQTAQADLPTDGAVKPAPPAATETKRKPKTASRREKVCRVDAPFVRVEFYCDDD